MSAISKALKGDMLHCLHLGRQCILYVVGIWIIWIPVSVACLRDPL